MWLRAKLEQTTETHEQIAHLTYFLLEAAVAQGHGTEREGFNSFIS